MAITKTASGSEEILFPAVNLMLLLIFSPFPLLKNHVLVDAAGKAGTSFGPNRLDHRGGTVDTHIGGDRLGAVLLVDEDGLHHAGHAPARVRDVRAPIRSGRSTVAALRRWNTRSSIGST
jgi:hypothetical protein